MTITLADVEQEVARRVGPFRMLIADGTTPTISTTTYGVVPYLQSSILLDEVSGLYALRRSAANTLDRQRRVAAVDPTRGTFEVDRPWQNPLVPSEVVEFHALDPDQELRPAVLAGLRRCLIEDRFQLGPGFIYEADLTASVPWVNTPSQVRSVQVAPYPAGWAGDWGGPVELPFEVFEECGHVIIRIGGAIDTGTYFGGVYVTAWHNAGDVINTCQAGPAAADTDTLSLDIDWAAAMGHIEAWHRFPARMQAASGNGWQASKADTAAEASRQAWIHRPPARDRFGFDRLEMWGTGSGWTDGSRKPLVVNS